ncbi:MAG TPA: PEGA domain-containing protein, partial [Terriglobia bacterium]|nr:PEGA domain-containing protein [Terriglobia bacterium]
MRNSGDGDLKAFSGISEETMPHTPATHACSADRKKSPRCWCGILLMLAVTVVPGPMIAQKVKPLSVKDVSELLQGSVASSEIARMVSENGISFRMSDDLERQFREIGATDELIDALRKASPPQATTPPPVATGMLKVQSQPGEAQVYVNDEPKGTTSPEGGLRLSGLDPGTYRLRVALTGYKTWENSVTVTAGETVTAFVTLEKQNLTPTVTLDADRNSIEAGQSVYLRWTSVNATDVDIEPGVGKVALAGATSVSPRESTTYTLTAIGPGGIKTATTSVGVAAPPPPPAPVVQPVVGNLPGFPVPGASFKEIKFFEGGYNPPPLGTRIYQTQFRDRVTHFVNWELHLTSPSVVSPVNFTIYATWYYPNG